MADNQEQEGLDLILAYRQVFSTEQGKKVIDDLIKRFMLRSSMSLDPHQIAFQEGERNIVLMLLHTLNIDEEQLRERIKHAKKKHA